MILAPNLSRSTYPLALSALLVPSLFAAPALANSFITVTGEATVESNARLGEAAPFDTDATGAPLPVDAAVISSGAFGDRLTASVEGHCVERSSVFMKTKHWSIPMRKFTVCGWGQRRRLQKVQDTCR